MKRSFLALSAFFGVLLLLTLPIAASAAETSPLSVETVTSKKGIKAWLVRDDHLPLLTLSFAFRGGVEQDPPEKQGLAEMTSALLTQGAGPLDAETFQDRLSNETISLSFRAGRDAIGGSLKTLRENRAEAITLLKEALTSPRFDPDSIERVRRQQATARRFQIGEASWQARYALLAYLYPSHPYSEQRLGTPQTLSSIGRPDLASFAKEHFARDNLIVAAAGSISPQELSALLDKAFGDLPAHAKLTPVLEAAYPSSGIGILVPRQGTQTDFVFALPGVKRDDPDFYAAEVANYILGGGGFSSRLMKTVRDQEGLTYGISTSLAPMEKSGLLLGAASTDNNKTSKAWGLVRSLLQKFHDEGASEAEIEDAKAYLTGSLPLSLTSTDEIASVLVGLQQDKLGPDFLSRYPSLIEKVTPADVRRVAERLFDPTRLVAAFAGEPEDLPTSKTVEQVKE